MYLYHQTLSPSSIIYHVLSGHFVDKSSTHVLYDMGKSFSLYLLEDANLRFYLKHSIHYRIKNMKVLQLKNYPRDLIVTTTDDYQLILFGYSKESGNFVPVVKTTLREEEVTGDYISVDDSGRFILIGSIDSTFCIYSILYDGNQISMQSGRHKFKSSIFYDMTICSVGENVYILTLFREYDSHRSKTLSIFSLQNGEDEELLQHCYTHAVPSTSNHIYQGIYNSLDYVIITRERGFELGILLNDNLSSITIPNSSLLSSCLIRNDWILLGLDSGGLVLYSKNTLRPVVLSENIQSCVFKQILELGDLLLLITEGGDSYVINMIELYQTDLQPVQMKQITQSISPCSEMCVSYENDGYPILSLISGRGATNRMIEGRFGLVLNVDKLILEGISPHIDRIRWKNDSLLCISNETQTNVYQLTNDSLLPFSLTEISQQPSILIGTIRDTLIQVTCDSIQWRVKESAYSQSIPIITKAFLFESELFIVVNAVEVWRWSDLSSYHCECIKTSDSPILQIDYLKNEIWIFTTSNAIHLMHSKNESCSVSLPYPPKSITHLSTFQSFLLLIQFQSSLQYYQVLDRSLLLLKMIPIHSNSTLSRVSINGIPTVILTPYLILPSSPYHLLPITILSKSFSISSSYSVIGDPSLSTSTLLVYDSQSIYLIHTSLQGSLDLQYESSVSSGHQIFPVSPDQFILKRHSSPSLVLYHLQNHSWNSQELSLSPITALTTLDSRVVAVVKSDSYELCCFSSFPDLTSSISFPLPSTVTFLQSLPQSHCVLICGDSLCIYHITHSIELTFSLTLPDSHITALLTYQNTIITTSVDGVITFYRFVKMNSLIRVLAFPSSYHISSACLLDPRSIAVATHEGVLCIFRCVRSLNDHDCLSTRSTDRNSMELVASIHLGTMITSMRIAPIPSHSPVLLYSTISGSIGQISQISSFSQSQTLLRIQSAVERKLIESGWTRENAYLLPSDGIIDGDVCCQFFDLSTAFQEQICSELGLDKKTILLQLCSIQSGM